LVEKRKKNKRNDKNYSTPIQEQSCLIGLKEHDTIVPEKQIFKCELCRNIYMTADLLTDHYATHFND
jgi:hypothetical protein